MNFWSVLLAWPFVLVPMTAVALTLLATVLIYLRARAKRRAIEASP